MRIVYTPHGPAIKSETERYGAAPSFVSQQRAIWPLAWRFFRRELSAKYRQSLLGVFWAMIVPLISVAVLLILNRSGIIRTEGLDVPYPVFIIVGISIWSLFATTLSACTGSLVGATSLITKIHFPRSALLLGHAGMGVVELLIRIPLITIVAVVYGVKIHAIDAALAFICLTPLFLLAVGLGAILSIAAALFREVMILLPLVLGVLMLLAPVMYPIGADTLLGRVGHLNPLNHYTTSARNLLLFGEIPGAPYWVCTASTLVILAIAVRLFRVAQTRIAERI